MKDSWGGNRGGLQELLPPLTIHEAAVEAARCLMCFDAPCTHADRKSTRLNSSHLVISYAVFCWKTKTMDGEHRRSGDAGVDLRRERAHLLVSRRHPAALRDPRAPLHALELRAHFFFRAPPNNLLHTLSLHAALPI